MQNKDGGWGAFDKDCDKEILTHVPFADHNAMIQKARVTSETFGVQAAFPYFDHELASAVVSHDLHDVLSVTDRVAVMRNGRLVGVRETEGLGRDEVLEMILAG